MTFAGYPETVRFQEPIGTCEGISPLFETVRNSLNVIIGGIKPLLSMIAIMHK